MLPDAEALAKDLERVGYLADEGLAMALHLSVRLGRPLLLEGEAGVGKTESARALSEALDTPLVRLQCYEGIDAGEALYEWNYARQLLEIRLAEARGEAREDIDLFAEPFLIERPLLRALRHPGPRPAVLLLDEVDRADPDFEAFLLELLADAAVSIPELGTVRAEFPPIAILTSNRTRELHDALKRRCLYHWIEYPGAERVIEIVARRVPGSGEPLARDVALAVDRIRALDVEKAPGVAEAIDWTAALGELGAERLSPGAAELSLGAAVKSPDDRAAVLGFGLERLTGHAD